MNEMRRMPPSGDEQNGAVSYGHAVGYTVLLGIIGALFVAISIVAGKSADGWLVQASRDLGVMLFPLFVVSLIYELALRKQFDRRSDSIMDALRRLTGLMTVLANDHGFVQVVYPGGSTEEDGRNHRWCAR